MPTLNRIVAPGPRLGTVQTPQGEVLTPPADWMLLAPGDAGLTRRVKAAGPTWTMRQKQGRKTFSLGVWAPAERVEQLRAELEAERATPAYARRQQSAANRRERVQAAYTEDFCQAVVDFLAFHPRYALLAARLAAAVSAHATPVGSGTVARTQRIPIEARAEAAVIAWLRHQTTSYDHMRIARVQGQRREVRRQLAARSRTLLEDYRQGKEIDPSKCPLERAL